MTDAINGSSNANPMAQIKTEDEMRTQPAEEMRTQPVPEQSETDLIDELFKEAMFASFMSQLRKSEEQRKKKEKERKRNSGI